jgi:PAS domain S-box-containing protein
VERVRGNRVTEADAVGFAPRGEDQVRLLRAAIETVPAGLLVLGGRDLRVHWANPAFARMLEDPWRVVDLRRHHPADFLPRAFENGLVELCKQVALGGRPHVDPEYAYAGFAGGVRYWNMSLLPLEPSKTEKADDARERIPRPDSPRTTTAGDPRELVPRSLTAGYPCDVMVAVTDITPQVLARDHLEGLAANAEYGLSQLEAVVNSMSEGLIVGDPDENVVSMNPTALRLHGYGSVEQVRRKLRDLADTFEASNPDGRPIAIEDWPLARALRGEQFAGYEIHLRRIDTGRTFIGNFNGTPVRNPAGRIVLAIVTFRDVTRQYQAERERAQLLAREQAARAQAELSEQRYRDLADAMPQIVWTARPDGYLDYFNRRWFAYTGFARERGCPPDGWASVAHAEDLPPALARWYESVRTGNEFVTECRFGRADGAYRWHLIRALPLRSESGRIVKWFGTCTDIDDQKRTEEAFKQAKEAAEAADRAKDQFLAVLSHELRTPLSPVLSGVQALQGEPDLSEDAHATLEMIRRNVELEARLIDDLLDLTKIARGKLQLDLEVTDVHQIVDSVVQMCDADCRAKGLRLVTASDASRHHVRGDPARLHQVLWNLIKNAVKFTPEHGTITVRTSGDDEWMRLDVVDTGIGIEPEMIPRIFFAFEQADASIAQRFGGLGLGLAISRSLIDMHGGKLHAASRGIGHGCTFTVELLTADAVVRRTAPPAQILAARPASAGCESDREPNVGTPNESPLRILMVDDHEDTSRALKRLLVRMGYNVQLANTVRGALDVARSQPFDLIISDIGLPDGSGLDLMRELCARVPIKGIALSGFGMEDDVRKSFEAGFREHLIKPVNLQKLQSVIRRVMTDGAAATSSHEPTDA